MHASPQSVVGQLGAKLAGWALGMHALAVVRTIVPTTSNLWSLVGHVYVTFGMHTLAVTAWVVGRDAYLAGRVGWHLWCPMHSMPMLRSGIGDDGAALLAAGAGVNTLMTTVCVRLGPLLLGGAISPEVWNGAPPPTYPATQPPTPPSRYLGVTIVRVGPHPLPKFLGMVAQHEPAMPGVQIHLVNWAVRVGHHGLVVLLRGPPEIRHVVVRVVQRFYARQMGAQQQDGTAARKGFNVVVYVAEAGPDEGCDGTFATEPGEGGFQGLWHMHSRVNTDPRMITIGKPG
jgi:hypothetical protein